MNNLILFQPSGANELVGGGNQADVKPDFAISGIFWSKFFHQSCLWDSQLKACKVNYHNIIIWLNILWWCSAKHIWKTLYALTICFNRRGILFSTESEFLLIRNSLFDGYVTLLRTLLAQTNTLFLWSKATVLFA